MRLLLLVSALAFSSAIDIRGLPIDIPDIPLPDLDDLNPVKIAELFAQFIKDFGKKYANPLEQSKALAAFGDNLKMIIHDLTDHEFASRVLMKEAPNDDETSYAYDTNQTTTSFQSKPSFDWRNTPNVVGPVRNQGSCGCCWAFTAAALVQSAYGIKHKKLIQPSEQQLCDCGMQDSSPGCNGGITTEALRYTQNHGLSLDNAYITYSATRATKANVCEDKNKPNTIKIRSYKTIRPSSASEMQPALVSNGPLGVAFKVGSSFRHYKSGIFRSEDCNSAATFIGWHAVAVVGYGEEKGTAYWIVKNSWGTSFGENGYFRFIKGTKLCSLETADVSYALG